MKKEFLHCLRIQFPPNHHEDSRIAEVVDFCVKYGFQNVMLFINAEEYNAGHMTVEETKPWLVTMKKAKAALIEKGISVSLNPWIELGHLDRCRPLKEGQNFVTMVDYDGNQASMVACPLCENWKNYFLSYYQYLIQELEPEVVWVEDDFRLHNHGDLRFGGCFCDLHMKKYNERLGTKYTREEFTDKLFRKEADQKVKKAWLDVNRECMRELAQEIGDTVRGLGLHTKIGLMSSAHENHALEGRDWYGIHKAFEVDGVMINRLHLPCYDEVSAKSYYLNFNRVPFHCRALLPEKTTIYPELENAAFSTFAKEARFLQFQLESAIPLCIEGMTYDIFDFVGNGAVEEFGYGEVVKGLTPYLNGVTKLGLQFGSLEGVCLPIDEKTAYNRKNGQGFWTLYPEESHFNAYIASLGITCKPTTKKSFQNKIVVLGCGNIYNFTKVQLEKLFTENYVILDGGAARILIDRGLGYLIDANGYKTYYAEHNVHSYEQVKDGIVVNGKLGYRATSYAKASDYVRISYNSREGAQSFVYDYMGNEVGIGIWQGERYFVNPYVMNGFYVEQYHDLRTTLLKNFIRQCNATVVMTNHAGVCAYLYKQKNKDVLIVVNSTEEDFKVTNLELQQLDFSKIYEINRATGRKKAVAFDKTEKGVCIHRANTHLTTQTFILTK